MVVLSLLLVLSGCSAIDKMTGGGFSYDKLSLSVVNPRTAESGLKEGASVEFVAVVSSEIQELEIDGEIHDYILVNIARSKREFFVEVSQISETYEIGEFVKITGKREGYLFSGDDEFLNIVASGMEKVTPEDLSVKNGPCENIEGVGTFTFKEAAFTKFTQENDTVVVYYDFEVSEDAGYDRLPLLNFEYFLIQGGELLESTMLVSNNKNENAGKDNNGVAPGTKRLLYTGLRSVNSSNDLNIIGYDDEFNKICDVDLTIEPAQ